MSAVDTYQLFENDKPVSDSSNSLGMWSRNMSTGGEFNYKCMANSSAGIAYSMSSMVTVNGKQLIPQDIPSAKSGQWVYQSIE